MNTEKLYNEYLSTSVINDKYLSDCADEPSKILAVTQFIKNAGIKDPSFAESFMKYLGYDGSSSDLAVKFISLSPDKSVAGMYSEDAGLREAVINHYCSVMANFIVFSAAQRKNLKDTASYNRHIDKALPEMCEALTVLFVLGADEGEYISSLEKYFEFTYYVNTPDSWNLFNSLYGYDAFGKYIASIRDKFLGIYLRSALLPESILHFVSAGDEEFTNAYITALSELASENTANARKMYSSAVIVEGNEEFTEGVINLYDGMKYKEALSAFRANGGKFHMLAIALAKDYYEYEESPRAKEF